MFLNPHNKPQQWFMIQISFQVFQENDNFSINFKTRDTNLFEEKSDVSLLNN